jgi:succinate-semialdehyde dehydrogenase/glutarate-semialdehyde dehydrogenase
VIESISPRPSHDRPRSADEPLAAVEGSPLLREDLFIGGRWTPASSGERLEVVDPATGATIACVACASREDVERAIEAARRAFPAWADLPAPERSRILRAWFELILEHVDELAAILTAEQGKPLRESAGEIRYGAGFIEWYAEEAKRLYGETIPTNVRGRRILTLREPVGVAATITPWNFPMAMIARKAGPALAAGCTLVVKPASETPCSALALAELAARAGLPAGVLNVVHGEPELVGDVLSRSPVVRALSFTGSTEVGRLLLAKCAATVKKVALELGGNAPLIVFDDADLGLAVEGAMASKFRNAGQTCVCANRILVQAGIHDRFVERLGAAVAGLRVGNGFDPDVDQGPLVSAAAVEKVREHIADAVALGARVTVGGTSHARGGTFFEPTVLVGATAAMRIASEETFGPVAPVFRFEREEEALALANATESGLAAYFFTRDLGRAWRVGEALEFGVIGVNTGLISYEGAPFGGVKQSGLGREGGRHGIDEYLDYKYLCLEGLGA